MQMIKGDLLPPNHQRFYRNLATVMNFYALGDRTWWGYESPNKFLLFHKNLTLLFAPITIISQVLYLVLNYKTLPFSTLGVIFSIFPIACITNVSVFSAQQMKYEKIMKDLFNKIHLHNYKDLNDFAKSKAIKVECYTRRTAYFLTICLMTDCVLWLLLPVMHFYKNIEGIKNQTVMLETLIYFWTPFDYRYNIRNWAIMHILCSYIGLSAVAIVITYNTVNYLFVFNLIGHIQILKHRFQTEFTGALSNNQATKEKLIDMLNYHSFIIKIFKHVQDSFGYNITANYCHNLFSDSLLLYQFMFGEKSDFILYGLMIIAYMGGLILMSMILEEIRRESNDLSDVIYGVPWENMSISNQKTLMMMLARAQLAFEFISAGGLRTGVRPAISIIKSTFSYYVMLKTTVKVDA